MKIAVLLTCHNRRNKTVRCLQSLKTAWEAYNEKSCGIIHMEIFLTDDGCTDGTAEGIREVFPNEEVLHVLHGDGNLYWAGGMRFCWKEASRDNWDYYLLLNDDVELMSNVFDELFYSEQWCIKKFGQEGLCSGITCWRINPSKPSYGGCNWISRIKGTYKVLEASGEPKRCDLANANILLVPKQVFTTVGMFYEGYQHGHADHDYGIMAQKAGFNVVVTAHYCGIADNDHVDRRTKELNLSKMSLKERKEYYAKPLNSINDYLCFVRRTAPIRFPLVWVGAKLRLYFPNFYNRLSSLR